MRLTIPELLLIILATGTDLAPAASPTPGADHGPTHFLTIVLPYAGAAVASVTAFYLALKDRNVNERSRYQTLIDSRLKELEQENNKLEERCNKLFEENAMLKARISAMRPPR